jgi:hypothetical protein
MTTRKSLRSIAGLALGLAFPALLAGCVTKSKAAMQAHIAYLAGQRDGLLQAQKQFGQSPSVTFLGPVATPVIRWTEGLTLSQAIVAAVYQSPADPAVILVRRGTETLRVDTKRLLAGEDLPLQAGDVIEFPP